MDRKRFLHLTATIAALVFVTGALVAGTAQPAHATGTCSLPNLLQDNCPTVSGEISGGGVNVGGSQTSPGGSNSGGSGNSGGAGSGNGSGSSGSGSGGGGGNGSGSGTGAGGGAVEIIPCPFPCRPAFTVTDLTEQPVTLSDIAHFRPRPGINHMQPAGWMIVNLDTNFYSTGGSQIHNGSLFGLPADVRFTPIRWHWTYGDGNRASHTGSGTTWAGNRVGEFDPTTTSHIYRAPGTYVIDLSIDFRAEYRFDGQAWTNIPGSIAVPSNRLTASAGTAKTVLVDRECTRSPRGPGC
jgi:hypothetical protein